MACRPIVGPTRGRRRYRVGWCVPALFRSLIAVDDDTADFQALRIFCIGGERILAS